MITVAPGPAKADELSDRCARGERIKFAGGVYEVERHVVVRTGARFLMDPANPPIFRRTGTCDRIFVPHGESIDFGRAVLDLNLGGPYVPFRCGIALAPPDNASLKPVPIRKVKCGGVRIISSTPITGHNGKDCWGFSLATDSEDVVEDLDLTGAVCDVADIQLCGGGSGPGFRRLRINECMTRGGRNAGIGLTFLNQAGVAVLEDVQICRNVLPRCYGLGITLGQDASGPDRLVRGKALVQGNYIEMAADGAAYQHALYFRDGPAAGDFGLEIDAVGNTLDFRRVPAAANAPRTVVFEGDNPASRLSFRRNRALSSFDLESGVSRAIRLTQSLNRYVPSGRELLV